MKKLMLDDLLISGTVAFIFIHLALFASTL